MTFPERCAPSETGLAASEAARPCCGWRAWSPCSQALALLAPKALLAVVLLVYAATIEGARFIFFDDTFYYLQIAWNTVHGPGFATFDGINPTNGFQALWQMVCIAVAVVAPGKSALLYGVAAASVVAHLLAAYVLLMLCHRATGRFGLPALFFALQSTLLFHALGGMEWSLATLMLVLLFSRMQLELARPASTPRPWPEPLALFAVACMLVMARTDLLALLGLLTAGWLALLLVRRGWRTVLVPGTLVAAGAVVAMGMQAIINVAAAGEVKQVASLAKIGVDALRYAQVPSVEYVEIVMGAARSLLHIIAVNTLPVPVDLLIAAVPWLGAERVDVVISVILLFHAVVVLAGLAALAWAPGAIRPRVEHLLLTALLTAWSLAHLGGVAWFIPSFAYHVSWYAVGEAFVVCLLLGGAIEVMLARGGWWRHGGRVLLVVVAGLMLATMLGAVLLRPGIAPGVKLPLEQAIAPARDLVPERAVVATWSAGWIGYFSGRTVVNLDGMVNSPEYLREVLLVAEYAPEPEPDSPTAGLRRDILWTGPLRVRTRQYLEARDIRHVFSNFGPAALEPGGDPSTLGVRSQRVLWSIPDHAGFRFGLIEIVEF